MFWLQHQSTASLSSVELLSGPEIQINARVKETFPMNVTLVGLLFEGKGSADCERSHEDGVNVIILSPTCKQKVNSRNISACEVTKPSLKPTKLAFKKAF